MPLDPMSTIEQLANASALVARQLCRLGIDAQTQAEQTLAQACEVRGLQTEKVAAELGALKPHPHRDWMMAPVPELVHHLVHHHHTFTREELARLQKVLDRALATPGPARPLLAELQLHFTHLTRDLTAHFQMEERNLFPAICAAENGGITPISLSTPSEQARTISAEHQAAEELFHNIRILTADYELPLNADEELRCLYLGLRNLEDDLHLHLFLENHILFPRALPH